MNHDFNDWQEEFEVDIPEFFPPPSTSKYRPPHGGRPDPSSSFQFVGMLEIMDEAEWTAIGKAAIAAYTGRPDIAQKWRERAGYCYPHDDGPTMYDAEPRTKPFDQEKE